MLPQDPDLDLDLDPIRRGRRHLTGEAGGTTTQSPQL